MAHQSCRNIFLEYTVNKHCVDICHSNPVENMDLKIYGTIHQGGNQTWHFENGQIVSSIAENLCLGVAKPIKNGSKVKLVDRFDVSRYESQWLLNADDTSIRLRGSSEFCLTVNKKNLIVKKGDDYSKCWNVRKSSYLSTNADSCHLWYGDMPNNDVLSKAKFWQLECTVNVQDVAEFTYYMVVGWNCGYSGIQQGEDGKKYAIFSMWDNHDHDKSVREVECGPGVTVSTFGGEGTGKKAMKLFPWNEKEDVKFVVKAKRIPTPMRDKVKYCCQSMWVTWRCSCWYEVGEEKAFMATFERTSEEVLLAQGGFYSFIEDWMGIQGQEFCRSAKFKDAKVHVNADGFSLNNATFTKNKCEQLIMDKAWARVCKDDCSFLLSTGGSPPEECDIVKNNTKLVLDEKK